MSTLRLDDVSPMIHFDAGWGMGTRADPLLPRYSDGGTFHSTTTRDAKATLQFNGTGISIFGARRSNHDTYTVRLDGRDTVGNGTGNDLFGEVLFSQQNLDNGPHTVEISDSSAQEDRGRAWLDVDYMIVNSRVDLNQYIIDHGAFQFSPEDAWTAKPNALSDTELVSMHVAQRGGSSATISFSGSAINLYGVACPTCGAFSVTLDGVPQGSGPFNSSTGQSEWFKPNTPFFFARNLVEDAHTLTVTSIDNSFVALQNVVVFSALHPPTGTGIPAPEPTGTQGSSNSPSNAASASASSSSNVAAIVGGTLGAASLILLLIALFLFFSNRRRKHASEPINGTPSANPLMGQWPASNPYDGSGSPATPALHGTAPWQPPPSSSNGSYAGNGGHFSPLAGTGQAPWAPQPVLSEKQRRQAAMRAFDQQQEADKVPPSYQ